MFLTTRLQLLFSAYAVLICVSFYEFIKDLFVTHNLLISTLHSYTNPINWCLFPFAFVIGFLIAKELEM